MGHKGLYKITEELTDGLSKTDTHFPSYPNWLQKYKMPSFSVTATK